jgi:murein DD-endopeptidase MepM/ murein hydrolase activator NlpD
MSPLTRDQLRSRRDVRRESDRLHGHRLLLTVVAPAVLVAALIAAVVLAFYGGDSTGEARAPAGQLASPVPPQGIAPAPAPQRVVLGRSGQVEVVLPVPRSQVTAVLFHPIAGPGALNMAPAAAVDHNVASDNGGAAGTAGVDVGAPAGTTVYAPVDGVITAVVPHRVAGRPEGLEIVITPLGVPGMAVRVSHIEPGPDGIVPQVGTAVGAGRTVIGRVRDLSRVATFALSRYTNDAGNNVQVELMRQATGPGV